MAISNKEFLNAIFGDNFIWAHVTDFFHDPVKNFNADSRRAWLGDYFVNRELRNYSNQYFSISLFHSDHNNHARRRKELFKSTHCIVIDDLQEKIPLDAFLGMPEPSWILTTSPNSHQLGYILSSPCKNRFKVEALLKGLVKKLCPGGIDSGMLGVTRYVRLPEGYNTKHSKMELNDNKPFKCLLPYWKPENKISIDALAKAYGIDLTNVKKSIKFDHKAKSDETYFVNHPIWDILQIKEIVAWDRYQIVCPWIDEHTDQADTGSMIFFGMNGKIGFKCHHGHCAERTGQDIIQYIIETNPFWLAKYDYYCETLRKENNQKFIICPIKISSKNTLGKPSSGGR